ncbi:MAG: cation transporter [Lachnospiraceae bacterium]|nr:cation transporter [Lachnospiraceae bacterium]
MKKTYKIDVDCAACADKMEVCIRETPGVKDAALSFMTLKVKVEFEDDADPAAVMEEARRRCKNIEDEMEIFL